MNENNQRAPGRYTTTDSGWASVVYGWYASFVVTFGGRHCTPSVEKLVYVVIHQRRSKHLFAEQNVSSFSRWVRQSNFLNTKVIIREEFLEMIKFLN